MICDNCGTDAPGVTFEENGVEKAAHQCYECNNYWEVRIE